MSYAMRQAAMERANALLDCRECEADEAPVLFLEDGTEKPLPTTWTVCDVCNGNGTHVNPSIDCGGLSAEDFAEDPDFEEAYFSGQYDQTCNKCQGRTTVRAVNWDAMSEEDQKLYQQQLNDEAADRRTAYYEARMGA